MSRSELAWNLKHKNEAILDNFCSFVGRKKDQKSHFIIKWYIVIVSMNDFFYYYFGLFPISWCFCRRKSKTVQMILFPLSPQWTMETDETEDFLT